MIARAFIPWKTNSLAQRVRGASPRLRGCDTAISGHYAAPTSPPVRKLPISIRPEISHFHSRTPGFHSPEPYTHAIAKFLQGAFQ
jgi:hypothetical protein